MVTNGVTVIVLVGSGSFLIVWIIYVDQFCDYNWSVAGMTRMVNVAVCTVVHGVGMESSPLGDGTNLVGGGLLGRGRRVSFAISCLLAPPSWDHRGEPP